MAVVVVEAEVEVVEVVGVAVVVDMAFEGMFVKDMAVEDRVAVGKAVEHMAVEGTVFVGIVAVVSMDPVDKVVGTAG